jgi:NADPH-dependent 2,4-dienoyl-CoA reductase/sulfur reductase-like enzyme
VTYRQPIPYCAMALLLALAFLTALASPQVAATSLDNKTYEYIVVGSGPGGGPIASNLARAGHSVLLLEAGCVFKQIIKIYIYKHD